MMQKLEQNSHACIPLISDLQMLFRSVADPGCVSRIPDPNVFHPGSRITDPNSFHLGSRIRIKEFKYVNPKKWFLSSGKYDLGSTLIFCPSRIPAPRSRSQKGTGSRIPDPDPQDSYFACLPGCGFPTGAAQSRGGLGGRSNGCSTHRKS
jgi:hypothetical protein